MKAELPPLFDDVNDVDRHTALRWFQTHDVSEGQVLLREGAGASGVVCVIRGELEVHLGATIVGRAGPGDLVGEMALFDDAARTATVIATRPGRVMVLDRSGYEALRDVVHPVATRLEQHAISLQVQRLRDVGARIARLAQGTPLQRHEPPTSGYFQLLADQFGRGGRFSPEKVDALETLGRTDLFAGAPRLALEQIAGHFSVGAYSPGHVLCSEGEVGRRMFVLDSGEVDVVIRSDDRAHEISRLTAGAAFGMVSMAQEGERMSTCIARTRVVVLELDLDGWRELTAEPYGAGSTFRRAMIRAFSRQLKYANAQLADFESTLSPDHQLEDLIQAAAGLQAHVPRLEAPVLRGGS